MGGSVLCQLPAAIFSYPKGAFLAVASCGVDFSIYYGDLLYRANSRYWIGVAHRITGERSVPVFLVCHLVSVAQSLTRPKKVFCIFLDLGSDLGECRGKVLICGIIMWS